MAWRRDEGRAEKAGLRRGVSNGDGHGVGRFGDRYAAAGDRITANALHTAVDGARGDGAPVGGVVGNRQVRVGRLVAPGVSLLDIVPVDDVWLVANFKETQLEQIRPGQRVRITIDGYPNAALEGVVDIAAENHALAFNCMANQQAQYPKTVVAAVLWHIDPVVDAAIAKLRANTLHAEDFGKLSLMRAKGSSLSPLGSFDGVVPAALVQRVRAREAEITSGKFVVPHNEKLKLNMR